MAVPITILDVGAFRNGLLRSGLSEPEVAARLEAVGIATPEADQRARLDARMAPHRETVARQRAERTALRAAETLRVAKQAQQRTRAAQAVHRDPPGAPPMRRGAKRRTW